MAKRNVHAGSRFDEFLKEEGIFEEVQAKALKRALAGATRGQHAGGESGRSWRWPGRWQPAAHSSIASWILTMFRCNSTL